MKNEFDTTQGNALQAGGAPKRRFMTKRKIIALSIVAVIILLSVWDILDPPLWWQFEAQKNKRAAIEYVNTNYPDAKFVKGYYRSTEFNPENNLGDQFAFDLDDVRFIIDVDDGRIVFDFYWNAYAEYQLYNTYLKPFVESRNITTEFEYIEFDLARFYKNNPNADISQFDGSVDFRILLHYDEESINPESLGWLYDFYIYCKEILPFSYTVTIISKESSTIFSNESEFENEDAFYNSFS